MKPSRFLPIISALFFVLMQPLLAHSSKQQTVHHHRDPIHRPKTAVSAVKQSPNTSQQPQDDADDIEQIQLVEPIDLDHHSKKQDMPTSAGSTGFSAMIKPEAMSAAAIAFIGHLHPAAVHLPIAWTLMWALVEALGPPLGLAPLAATALPLGIATVVSFLPSVVTGLSRLTELSAAAPGGAYDAYLAITHRNLMFVAWAILAVALFLRLLWARWPLRILRRTYVLTLVVGTFVVLYSAHLGGRLVYGDDFLRFPWQ